jgi:thiamine pyrophosphate-dependent acetolactate synthase large subunit-like protein
VAGSRLGNLGHPYDKYWGDPERQPIVQIDVDPRPIGVTRPLAIEIVAEVSSALEGFVRVLDAHDGPRRDRRMLERYREIDRRWLKEAKVLLEELG